MIFRRASFAQVAAALALVVRPAFGQVPGPSSPGPGVERPPEVTPPLPLEVSEAEYPPAARESRIEATVVLRLTIDAEGAVKNAEVVEPTAEGFGDAARAALLRSRFAPATKDGRAVGAKILYRYEFRLPPEPGPEDATPKDASPVAAAPAADTPKTSESAPKKGRPAAGADASAQVPLEVTILGERSEADQIQRSAMPVTVVEMKRHSKRSSDMGEVLARTFGVSIRRSGGLGSDTRFSLNGLQDDQIRTFINGIPIEHTFPNNISNIPVNLVERVEIYRGVVPVRYAADALGGAVNIITNQHFENRVGGSYQLGSFGTRRATVLGRYRDPVSGFVLGIETFADGAKNDYEVDVKVPDERGRLHAATVPRFHDRYRAYGVAVDAGFTDVPWARRFVLRALTTAYDKQLQNNLVMTVPYGEVEYGEALRGLQLHYEHTLFSRLDVEFRGSYAHTTTFFSDQSPWVYDWFGSQVRPRRIPGEIEAKPTDQVSWQKMGFGRLGFAYRLADGHRVRLATSSDYTTRTGDERLQADPTARDPLTAQQDLFKQVTGFEYELGLFDRREERSLADSDGHFDHRLQNVFFVKSYLYRVDSEEPLPGGIFRQRDQNQHRFGLGDGVRVVITDYLYAKASYELTTRMPRADEVFGDGVLIHGNLELTPEISDNANLGVRLELEESPAGKVMVDVNSFFRDTREQIVLLGNDRFFTYENVYRAVSKGIEGAFEWTTPWKPLAFDGSFTWVDYRNQSDAGAFEDFKGDRIPNRPWLFAAFSARVRMTRIVDRHDELEPFYTARYVHEYCRGWESVGLKQYKQVIPSQLIMGAGVTYTLRRNTGDVWTTLEVQNFTDQATYDFYGQQRPGRAFFWKVTAMSR